MIALDLEFQHQITNEKEVTITVEEEYKRIFYDYYHKTYRYALTIVKDEEEAKDIVQNAFVKLWEKRNAINFTSAGSYVYTTVYHLALNATRNHRAREKHHVAMLRNMNKIAQPFPEAKEVETKVMSALEDLPPKCKAVFVKSRFDGKKYAEIANELGISIKTVEAQMGKALKMLREKLADVTMLCILHTFFN